MKWWVDPPVGYRFGFPKVWDDEEFPDLHIFLIRSGYPAAITSVNHTRMWEYKEDE